MTKANAADVSALTKTLNQAAGALTGQANKSTGDINAEANKAANFTSDTVFNPDTGLLARVGLGVAGIGLVLMAL